MDPRFPFKVSFEILLSKKNIWEFNYPNTKFFLFLNKKNLVFEIHVHFFHLTFKNTVIFSSTFNSILIKCFLTKSLHMFFKVRHSLSGKFPIPLGRKHKKFTEVNLITNLKKNELICR